MMGRSALACWREKEIMERVRLPPAPTTICALNTSPVTRASVLTASVKTPVVSAVTVTVCPPLAVFFLLRTVEFVLAALAIALTQRLARVYESFDSICIQASVPRASNPPGTASYLVSPAP